MMVPETGIEVISTRASIKTSHGDLIIPDRQAPRTSDLSFDVALTSLYASMAFVRRDGASPECGRQTTIAI